MTNHYHNTNLHLEGCGGERERERERERESGIREDIEGGEVVPEKRRERRGTIFKNK